MFNLELGEDRAGIFSHASTTHFLFCLPTAVSANEETVTWMYRVEITVLSTLLTPLALAGCFSYAYRLLTWKAPGTTAQSNISSQVPCLRVPETPGATHKVTANSKSFSLVAMLEYNISLYTAAPPLIFIPGVSMQGLVNATGG